LKGADRHFVSSGAVISDSGSKLCVALIHFPVELPATEFAQVVLLKHAHALLDLSWEPLDFELGLLLRVVLSHWQLALIGPMSGGQHLDVEIDGDHGVAGALFELLHSLLGHLDVLEHDLQSLVKRIIEFRERMVELLNKSLEKDSTVELTIKNSFESFINENEKTAKSLVMYLDDQFKKDFKNNTEVEISEKVDKIIQIFRYLQDKDIFESFYKNYFAKRLLDSRRVLEDAEKEVIKKLKEECGYNFTQRLEVMFKDIKMSEQRI
jgi:hypothetical protein